MKFIGNWKARESKGLLTLGEMSKKENRGGARKNAGRKPKPKQGDAELSELLSKITPELEDDR